MDSGSWFQDLPVEGKKDFWKDVVRLGGMVCVLELRSVLPVFSARVSGMIIVI